MLSGICRRVKVCDLSLLTSHNHHISNDHKIYSKDSVWNRKMENKRMIFFVPHGGLNRLKHALNKT